MPDPALLSILFNKPPEDAIRALDAKGLRMTFNWHEMLDAAHARAFTVAKAMRLDILQDIRGALLTAIETGQTLRDFQAGLAPLLKAKGWWGKDVVVDPQTWDAQLVQLGSSRRLKTIYQTNLQSAYMAGRYARQMESALPNLMYVAVMDGRTRPSHAALNGRVLRKDDPAWGAIYPPNGFNCRCRTRAMTDGQVVREGRTVESSAGRMVTREINAGVDKVSGEISKTVQSGIRVTDPVTGKPLTMWVDAGFNASPVAAHTMDDLLYAKARAALPASQALSAVAAVLSSAPRRKAWTSFVDNTLAVGRKQGQTIGIGLLPEAAVQITGQPAILYVEDRQIVGRKALRHEAAGDALSAKEWRALPERLDDAVWYRDRNSGDFVALMGEKGNDVAAIFAPTGALDTAYKDRAAPQKIREGLWVKIQP